MPRGAAPGWRARKPPVLDHWLMAVVNRAGGAGHHTDGCYGELHIDGFADQEEALEYEKALYRCAAYMHRNGIADISVHVDTERRGGEWIVRYQVYDKTWGRKHIMEKHGPDRSRWPYDVRRKVTA
jgi:hypothetical protein